MSARTAVEVADRRRDLAQRDIRAADPLGRAAAYALAAQQAPALVLAGSWVVSLVRDGVRPAQVREALAAAQGLTSALAFIEDACGWRTPVGLVNDVLIGCAGGPEADAIRTALAAERAAEPCCSCGCAHRHDPDPRLAHRGGARCIACRWCHCRSPHIPTDPTLEDR